MKKKYHLAFIVLFALLFFRFYTYRHSQVITFKALENKLVGAPDFSISAESSAGLPVVFEVVSGPAILAGNTVTVTGIGKVLIKASQQGDDDFLAAENVLQSFAVDKANPSTDLEIGGLISDGGL